MFPSSPYPLHLKRNSPTHLACSSAVFEIHGNGPNKKAGYAGRSVLEILTVISNPCQLQRRTFHILMSLLNET